MEGSFIEGSFIVPDYIPTPQDKVIHGIRAYLTPVCRLTPETMKVQLRYLKLKMTEVVSCEEQNICIDLGFSTFVSTQVPSMFAQQMVKSLSELCVPEGLHASAIERLQHLVLEPMSLSEIPGQLVHLDIYELEVDNPIKRVSKVFGVTPFFVPKCMENIYTPTPVEMIFWKGQIKMHSELDFHDDFLRKDDTIRGVRAYLGDSTMPPIRIESVVIPASTWKRVMDLDGDPTHRGRDHAENTPADVEYTPEEASRSIKLKLKLRYCRGIVIDTLYTFVMGEVTSFKETTIDTTFIRYQKWRKSGNWLEKVLTDMEVPSHLFALAVDELNMILWDLPWTWKDDCPDALAYLDMYDGNLILPHLGCLDEPEEPLEIPECLLNDPDCIFWF